MLSLHQISCHRGARLLIRNFSLTVGAGEAVWLTGPNGIGKSTLLHVMAGLQPPLTGAVQRRQPFLYLPSDPGFDDELTLGQNLGWWAGLYKVDKSVIQPAAEKLDLVTALPLTFGALSKGQQQRAALARLLMVPRRLWLLDEPTAHLDANGRRLAAQIMDDQLRQGGGIVAATHDVLPLVNERVIALGEVAA